MNVPKRNSPERNAMIALGAQNTQRLVRSVRPIIRSKKLTPAPAEMIELSAETKRSPVKRLAARVRREK